MSFKRSAWIQFASRHSCSISDDSQRSVLRQPSARGRENAPLSSLSPCLDTPSNEREEQRHPLGADNPNTSIDDNLGEHYVRVSTSATAQQERRGNPTIGIVMLHLPGRHHTHLVRPKRSSALQTCTRPRSAVHLRVPPVQVQSPSLDRLPRLLRAIHTAHFQRARKVDHTRDRMKAVLHGQATVVRRRRVETSVWELKVERQLAKDGR